MSIINIDGLEWIYRYDGGEFQRRAEIKTQTPKQS